MPTSSGPIASGPNPRKLFLVGCPRSGTTWLQIMIASHDKVATVRETHLFGNYLNPIYERWGLEQHTPVGDGLRVFMSLADIDRACRGFADVVFERIAEQKPGAEIVLEKTPTHLRHHRMLKRLYPDAKILHIVRDPRAVAASLLAVSREEWGRAVPGDVLSAARLWRMSVRIGRDELAGYGEDYLELRYEDLHATPDAVLARICAWLGILPFAYDPSRFGIEALRDRQREGSPVSPSWDGRSNFFRHGRLESWRDELTREETQTVEAVCADLMGELGYPISG